MMGFGREKTGKAVRFRYIAAEENSLCGRRPPPRRRL